MPYFNQCGVDGLIVKKRPGTMAIIDDQQAPQLVQLIDEPQQAHRIAFGQPKPFMVTSGISIRSNAVMRRWYGFFTTNEEKLLERLDQAILDVVDNPEKIQQTTAIGTLF